jgi:hypothetical protein
MSYARGHPCLRQGFGRQARTMKIDNPHYSPLNLRGDEGGLGLRLRSPFRLVSTGYVKFLGPIPPIAG